MHHNGSTIILDSHKHRFFDSGGSKPTLLLLHGISCSFDFFEQVIPLLSRSFRVLALDLLGFGSYEKNLLISRDKKAIDTVMVLNRNFRRLDLSRTGLRQDLGRINIPVLILWGDHDQYISPSVARRAHKEISGSELYIFKDCGHAPMLEYPEPFSKKVTRFLLEEKQ
ncbi:MAG: alpha/beta fold hydrolase [Chlorobiales bacterium]|nr:alpha/beta fold hydrolase [Chlorobiales bacterium]